MFSLSLLTRMSTRNFQATPKKISKVSVPATPKKIFKHQSRQILVHAGCAKQLGIGHDQKTFIHRQIDHCWLPQKISLSGQTLIQDKYIDLK